MSQVELQGKSTVFVGTTEVSVVLEDGSCLLPQGKIVAPVVPVSQQQKALLHLVENLYHAVAPVSGLSLETD